MCISQNKLYILGRILCISEIILCNFRGKFSAFEEYFVHYFWKYFFAFQKNIWCNSGNILDMSKSIWCNSGNIWCIMKERFCVFKKTLGTFFQERILAFFRGRFCALQKRFCVFQQTFCVFREKYFAPFDHRKK